VNLLTGSEQLEGNSPLALAHPGPRRGMRQWILTSAWRHRVSVRLQHPAMTIIRRAWIF
jgi:hypothetical protein